METKQSMNNKYQVGRYNLVLFKWRKHMRIIAMK
jgi:hypothetical protein